MPETGSRSRQVKGKGGKEAAAGCHAWLQGLTVFVRDSPYAVPELMSYRGTIIRANQEHEGVAWADYDAGYLGRQRQHDGRNGLK